MFTRLRAHLPAWRRALRRRRRMLTVLAVAAVAAALLPSLLPPSARGVEVVVAEVAVGPGTVLAEEHLGTARIAAELVPAGTAGRVEQLLGSTTLVGVSEGTPLLPSMLEGSGDRGIPEGSVLMTVPVPASLAGHLGPGTSLELLPSDLLGETGPGIPARVVEVVGTPGVALGPGDSGSAAVEALVLVDRERSRDVAHALSEGAVVVTVFGYSPTRTAPADPP